MKADDQITLRLVATTDPTRRIGDSYRGDLLLDIVPGGKVLVLLDSGKEMFCSSRITGLDGNVITTRNSTYHVTVDKPHAPKPVRCFVCNGTYDHEIAKGRTYAGKPLCKSCAPNLADELNNP